MTEQDLNWAIQVLRKENCKKFAVRTAHMTLVGSSVQPAKDHPGMVVVKDRAPKRVGVLKLSDVICISSLDQ